MSEKNERNALAELAERIDPIDPHPLDDDYMKASCIIARLAKVRVSSEGRPNITDLLNLFYDCRAIAEEGDGDGK